MTFTPGPWRTEVGTRWSVLIYAGNRPVASVVINADAHLIAAAPDLYEALEEAYGWLPGGTKVSQRAEAALSRARGGTE